MLTRKLVAYVLIAVLAIAFAGWHWHRRRTAARLREERHGPRRS